MNKKQQETQQARLKRLELLWYNKLARTGFRDAEDSQGRLKRWHSFDLLQASVYCKREAKERYYELCAELLLTTKFDSALDAKVWKLHASGLSVRAIAAKVRVSKSYTHKIVKRLREQHLRLGVNGKL